MRSKLATLAVAAAAAAAGIAGAPARAAGTDIVETAIAAGQFKTLAAALDGAGLVATLKGPGPFTVFAPTDAAFAKLPAGTLDYLLKPENKARLTAILTYHVVPGQIAPDAIVGEQTTVEGESVEVTGSGDNLKVNDASVICGGVQTENATVYLIDSVLMPGM